MNLSNLHITVIGLGYVGLPLAIEFGKKYLTTGFDINKERINELKNGYDRTMEIDTGEFKNAKLLTFVADIGNYDQNRKSSEGKLKNVYIVTVPTPIDNFKKPDLRQLLSASKLVGQRIKKGDIVIYESTVYPGCTEEDCIPVLEKVSGLIFNSDFFCGYSPERINPGDKQNTLTKILKITSGSNDEIADFVDSLYSSIIEAGTFKTSSIKVAEAAKIIENCQRDVNISFVNELALIFDRMNIDTSEVLEAAATKWNFLRFKPGLVGGHCISVDPYYMIYKAESLGYHPEVIGAGRRLNDNMGVFIASKIVKLMIQSNIQVKGAKTLILGFTYKENCSDTRNTRVLDIYNELMEYNINVDIYDPWANKQDVEQDYNIILTNDPLSKTYDAVVLAVSHREFLSDEFKVLKNEKNIIFDIKSVLNKTNGTYRL